jgi:hypothetical protein
MIVRLQHSQVLVSGYGGSSSTLVNFSQAAMPPSVECRENVYPPGTLPSPFPRILAVHDVLCCSALQRPYKSLAQRNRRSAKHRIGLTLFLIFSSSTRGSDFIMAIARNDSGTVRGSPFLVSGKCAARHKINMLSIQCEEIPATHRGLQCKFHKRRKPDIARPCRTSRLPSFRLHQAQQRGSVLHPVKNAAPSHAIFLAILHPVLDFRRRSPFAPRVVQR